ncbi:thiosulfate sulfurtransferase [Corynebacterium phocae]|uniref:Sulfurtransferase n=1 Tax=Corynebacterium phocae TaxID=161895 RepID=A0A1L7D5C3_9CORY|nr:sulfurtransferase [Corynebacterium phocae]APT93132.1 thiosulfate sulfurtransferase [Corynebacterium phocae]KAA8722208.1 sulfurtransferase [Corynebacterium phocae]
MIDIDPNPAYSEFADPSRLVSAPWLSARLGVKGLRVLEVDEDILLYDIGHIPTASRLNCYTELQDPVTRDIVSAEGFSKLMREKGINRDDTIVLYGDKNNWWAAYALWVFELFGHPDVRLLDGGRDAWMTEERDTSYVVPTPAESDYPEVERNDSQHRAFVNDLSGLVLIDTRPEAEYRGAATTTSQAGDSTYGTTIRHGHIPGAINLPWNSALHPNGVFRSPKELAATFSDLDPKAPTALYSHLGAQSAHGWFVTKFLLGFDNVKNYDGSWAEWGNMVRMPIER